jgi:hypothetical protein
MDLGTCMHKQQILSSLKGEIPMRPPPFSILQPPLIHERKFLRKLYHKRVYNLQVKC